MPRACLGGWCPVRDHCARHLQEYRIAPIERACLPKMADRFEPTPAHLFPVIPIKEAA